MTRRIVAALSLLLALAAPAGCARPGAGGHQDGRLSVVTAFYPLQFLAERIGGPTVAVSQLTKPGAEPHDVELNPRQVADIVDAGVVVYLSGFQPAVDQAVRQEATRTAFDVGRTVELEPLHEEHGDEDHGHEDQGHEHAEGALDPHVWLDPVRYATIADALGARLGRADPAHAADYTARAAAVRTELQSLDTEYAAALATCRRRELVTSHAAFNYLAHRYDLHEVGITGISPDAEPSPRRLAEVAKEARETGTTTIFFETLVSPEVADTIAREVGARTAVLDPIEGRTDPGTDYFTVMRANLDALVPALGCTS